MSREARRLLGEYSSRDGKEQELSYDKLVLGIGSRPRSLSIPGSHLEGVFSVSDLNLRGK